jgi:hypothetical protein
MKCSESHSENLWNIWYVVHRKIADVTSLLPSTRKTTDAKSSSE